MLGARTDQILTLGLCAWLCNPDQK